jgi:hypothetical protein|nr:MAG TPA: hypothetical protein [Bacteriophage sp.]
MEFILCSAIKRIKPRETKCNYHKNDIHKVELGYRHHDILIRFRGEVSANLFDQGFYTSLGRFVDRKEAYKIAYDAGQLKNPEYSEDYEYRLFSEDLY